MALIINAAPTDLAGAVIVRRLAPRVWSGRLVLAMIIFYIVGAEYIIAFVEETTSGRSWYRDCVVNSSDFCTYFLYDSIDYLEKARSETLKSLIDHAAVTLLERHSGIGTLNNMGLLFQGRIALLIAPKYPYLLIFTMNYFLVLCTVLNYRRIAFGLHMQDRVVLYMLANPLILLYSVSLTKDIWGLYFVSAFVRYALEKRRAKYLLCTALAVVFREVYGVIGSVILVLASVKARWWSAVALLSASGWAIQHLDAAAAYNAIRESRSADVGQASATLMRFLYEVQQYLFGNILTYIPIMFLNLFSPLAAPFRYKLGIADVNWYATIISSALFAVSAFLMLRRPRALLKIFELPEYYIIVISFFSFTVVQSYFPFVHHRYYLPVFPLMVLLAAAVSRLRSEVVPHAGSAP